MVRRQRPRASGGEGRHHRRRRRRRRVIRRQRPRACGGGGRHHRRRRRRRRVIRRQRPRACSGGGRPFRRRAALFRRPAPRCRWSSTERHGAAGRASRHSGCAQGRRHRRRARALSHWAASWWRSAPARSDAARRHPARSARRSAPLRRWRVRPRPVAFRGGGTCSGGGRPIRRRLALRWRRVRLRPVACRGGSGTTAAARSVGVQSAWQRQREWPRRRGARRARRRVGCGHGRLLNCAAQRLRRGRAFGTRGLHLFAQRRHRQRTLLRRSKLLRCGSLRSRARRHCGAQILHLVAQRLHRQHVRVLLLRRSGLLRSQRILLRRRARAGGSARSFGGGAPRRRGDLRGVLRGARIERARDRLGHRGGGPQRRVRRIVCVVHAAAHVVPRCPLGGQRRVRLREVSGERLLGRRQLRIPRERVARHDRLQRGERARDCFRRRRLRPERRLRRVVRVVHAAAPLLRAPRDPARRQRRAPHVDALVALTLAIALARDLRARRVVVRAAVAARAPHVLVRRPRVGPPRIVRVLDGADALENAGELVLVDERHAVGSDAAAVGWSARALAGRRAPDPNGRRVDVDEPVARAQPDALCERAARDAINLDGNALLRRVVAAAQIHSDRTSRSKRGADGPPRRATRGNAVRLVAGEPSAADRNSAAAHPAERAPRRSPLRKALRLSAAIQSRLRRHQTPQRALRRSLRRRQRARAHCNRSHGCNGAREAVLDSVECSSYVCFNDAQANSRRTAVLNLN